VYTLERIEVRGNTRTRDSVVQRYLPFRPGRVLDAEDPELELVRYRLLGTGFFRDVQLSLEKGSRPGQVVLVVTVAERNTVVLNNVWMGLAADADNDGNARPMTAFAGLDVAETNLLGTGISLGGAMALAHEQLALRLNVLDPALFGSEWMGRATFLYNDAKDYFGNSDVLYSDPKQQGHHTESAVLRYERLGGVLGVGRDLTISTQLWLNYRFEAIDGSYPRQASHKRGLDHTESIDFSLIQGQSYLSTLGAALHFDTRDHPFLPTRGWLVDASTEVGLRPIGSDYGYQRADLRASHYWPVGSRGHALRLDLVGGAISGNAPFFEQYHVGDFSDFLPPRILGVNFDRRPPPNFLATQIAEVRYGTYAAALAAEYRVPLYRGSRSIFGIDLFGRAGIYAVADEPSINDPAPGYSGLHKIPVDLTANFGVRMDTSAGGFVFALSNVLTFIPVGGRTLSGE
jgi:outer membrane protein assembly factor BamA